MQGRVALVATEEGADATSASLPEDGDYVREGRNLLRPDEDTDAMNCVPPGVHGVVTCMDS